VPVPVSVIATATTTAFAGRITAEFDVVEAVTLVVAAKLAMWNGKFIIIEPAEAVRVWSPPVERQMAEVVAFVMTNCPSYKDQPINRVCVCWGSLIGVSPSFDYLTTFLGMCNIFDKIILGVKFWET